MKKNRFFAFVSAISLTAGLLFTSCYDNIYSLIEREVAIDNDGLNGDISNIVRCGDYLFLSNGTILGKKAEPRITKNWRRTTTPVTGSSEFNVSHRVQMLAADSTYVYALTFYYNEGDDGSNFNFKRAIYAAKAEDFPYLNWSLVNTLPLTTGYTIGDDYHSIKNIFDNKSNTSRNAYVNIMGNIFKLNGTDTPVIQYVADRFIGGKNAITQIMNCANFKGTDYFSNYYAFAANDDNIYFAPTYTKGDSHTISNSSLFYYTSNPSSGIYYSLKAKHNILSLAMTKDFLFYGTDNGLERLCIDPSSSLMGQVVSFKNNGDSVISEHVYMVYALDETKPMNMTDLYCASTIYSSISSSTDSYDSIGLYACNAGGKWDRDGE
ncbi:MAG: hypothetical protein Q4B64_09325 [Spirochaetales bacterium]|nr:hypothetical protein [Spirochaetales bacterium]